MIINSSTAHVAVSASENKPKASLQSKEVEIENIFSKAASIIQPSPLPSPKSIANPSHVANPCFSDDEKENLLKKTDTLTKKRFSTPKKIFQCYSEIYLHKTHKLEQLHLQEAMHLYEYAHGLIADKHLSEIRNHIRACLANEPIATYLEEWQKADENEHLHLRQFLTHELFLVVWEWQKITTKAHTHIHRNFYKYVQDNFNLVEQKKRKKDPIFCSLVAICLLYGLGISSYRVYASQYFTKAYKDGCAYAACYISEFFPKENDRKEFLGTLAKNGNCFAIILYTFYHLKTLSNKGKDSISLNERKALFDLLEKPFQEGCAFAMCLRGICYYNGVGVEKNIQKAVELLKRAEELGCSLAANKFQIKLSSCRIL